MASLARPRAAHLRRDVPDDIAGSLGARSSDSARAACGRFSDRPCGAWARAGGCRSLAGSLAAGLGRLVVIEGAAGTGKSTLLAALEQRAAERRIVVRRATGDRDRCRSAVCGDRARPRVRGRGRGGERVGGRAGRGRSRGGAPHLPGAARGRRRGAGTAVCGRRSLGGRTVAAGRRGRGVIDSAAPDRRCAGLAPCRGRRAAPGTVARRGRGRPSGARGPRPRGCRRARAACAAGRGGLVRCCVLQVDGRESAHAGRGGHGVCRVRPRGGRGGGETARRACAGIGASSRACPARGALERGHGAGPCRRGARRRCPAAPGGAAGRAGPGGRRGGR